MYMYHLKMDLYDMHIYVLYEHRLIQELLNRSALASFEKTILVFY